MERVVLGKFIKEYSKKNKENNPYPVYSVTNSNGFCTEYFTKDVSSEDKRNYKIVPFGYFAYNPSRINVGSVDCQQKEPYVVVSPLYTVFSVSSDLDKNYLKYFFKSRYCSNLINSKVSGSVRNNLKFNILSTFELPYCSVEKQQQAVKQFENIKSLINCEVKQLSLLDELIKSRFIELFGNPDLSPQKADWQMVTSFSQIVTGTTPATGDPDNWDGDILWVTPAEIEKEAFYLYDTERKITEKGRKSKSLSLMPKGTVILSTRAPIGKVAIVGKEMTCNQGFKNFVCKKNVNPVYLYFLLKYNTDYLNSIGSGTTF
ncbi:MAG: restriction endonuclease subunit S, partial [Bacilli bacterium]|nr:restriction endonuclease subunit S [Bacilli bacterium]